MGRLVLGRRSRTPSVIEYFRQEVPFRTDYPDFRLEVASHRRTRRSEVRPIRERMVFDEREIAPEKRAEGYRYHPEVLIDEYPDLRDIHEGYTMLETPDGELVRLQVFLFRDPDRWVLGIRFATIGIEAHHFTGSTVTGIAPDDVEAAKDATVDPMRAAVNTPPEPSWTEGWSAIGYSRAQLEYMEWLDAYRDGITLLVMTSPAHPLMDETTREVEPYLFPEIQAHEGLGVTEYDAPAGHPYWEGPSAYPVRLHAARRALEVWNEELTTNERIAAHARFLEIVGRLNRLYAAARRRMME